MRALVAGILELIDSPLYDTVAIPRPSPDADLPPVELFRDPIGIVARALDGTRRVKTELETNLYSPSQLELPHKFLVRSIRAALLDQQGGLKGISSTYYRGAMLRFWINGKPYWQGPLYLVADPAVFWCEGAAPFAGLSTEEREAMIRAMRHTFEENERPMIDTQMPFGCRLTLDPTAKWDGAFAPAGIVVVLEGIEARAFQ